MSKFSRAMLAGAVTLGLCGSALAATPVRVRGEIASVSGNSVVVHTYGGHNIGLMLEPHTHYVSVVPASLSHIKPGEFVGIGATGPRGKLTALEVVIFPASMRGTGEGHYAWSVPAAVADADRHHAGPSSTTGSTAGAPPVQGTMTNGTVTSAGSTPGAPPVQGTMTNGTVASQSGNSGGKELAVSYKGGKVNIMVPAGVPVVRLVVANRSIVASGAKVFAVGRHSGSGATLHAVIFAVGKNGLMPPM